MKIYRWLPLIAVALAFLVVLSYVVANPLPANGYGRSTYDVHTTLAIPAGSSRTILMAEGFVVPIRSLVFVMAGVMTKQPGSDISETAYFRMTHAGTTIAQGDMSPFSESFETRMESSGYSDNPALFIRNDHAFDLAIDFRAFVVRPPSTSEHFALHSFILFPMLAAAIVWAGLHGRQGKRSVQPI